MESRRARNAEVARQMLAGGEFPVSHMNGEIYLDKPPVYFRAISLAANLASARKTRSGGRIRHLLPMSLHDS